MKSLNQHWDNMKKEHEVKLPSHLDLNVGLAPSKAPDSKPIKIKKTIKQTITKAKKVKK